MEPPTDDAPARKATASDGSMSAASSLAHDDQRNEAQRCSRKKRHAEDEVHEDERRKLSKREEMQLKLLASLPTMSMPLRDARGRRRSTCVSSEEIVEAGLSALVASHTVGAAAAVPVGEPREDQVDSTATARVASDARDAEE